MSNLAETILRDVKRYSLTQLGPVEGGQWLHYPDVLSAITAAMDPAIAERAGEVLERLQKADEYEPLGHDGWDAADLITALLTANAALRAERDEYAEAIEVNNAVLCEALLRAAAADRIEALTAQVERLTEELELRDRKDAVTDDEIALKDGLIAELQGELTRARAALSATKEEGHE